MKVITFLRHSKSSWENNIEDIHRPLSQIGIEKIKKIANSSKDHFISSEIIFTSSANRALYTSVLLTRILSINLNKIKICDELYTFNYNKVFDFIKTIDNKKFVSMNIFSFFGNQIYEYLRDCEINEYRGEKEIASAIQNMVNDKKESIKIFKICEHVPDLTLKDDIQLIKSFLK